MTGCSLIEGGRVWPGVPCEGTTRHATVPETMPDSVHRRPRWAAALNRGSDAARGRQTGGGLGQAAESVKEGRLEQAVPQQQHRGCAAPTPPRSTWWRFSMARRWATLDCRLRPGRVEGGGHDAGVVWFGCALVCTGVHWRGLACTGDWGWMGLFRSG
ncbi:hypothetical protein T440DRAFT_296468 [Plenodomus tracheiphilus IPT5]|uniref:Uncharacterized protein n=1 Tax=Plenodomus tracheiphilus IPT5 TaxID=1408161 RepID=A0A6A7BET8_9PLEO|nr:hypothetical protein T440DRAFT_296468 [Plenodomus tracheiphilus IPT5]